MDASERVRGLKIECSTVSYLFEMEMANKPDARRTYASRTVTSVWTLQQGGLKARPLTIINENLNMVATTTEQVCRLT